MSKYEQLQNQLEELKLLGIKSYLPSYLDDDQTDKGLVEGV